MVERLDVEQTRQMLLCVAQAVMENKQLLTELDSKIGDGDHGIGMALGFEEVQRVLSQNEPPIPDVNGLFTSAGMAMLNSMGGASGVIFGTMFSGRLRKMESLESLDGPRLTQVMRGALEAVKERGKAQPGDKTMVDALEPAVAAMEEAASTDLLALLAAAEAAAYQGAQRTKEYVARFGRAKSLMERSVGHQDAGATSVWLIFGAMHRYLASL